MTISLESGSQSNHREPGCGNGKVVALIQRAIERTLRFCRRVAIFDKSVLSQVQSCRREGAHSADVADELHILHFAAIAQIDQTTDACRIREGESDRTKGVADRTSGRGSVAKRNREGGRLSAGELMLIACTHDT